MLKKIQKTIRSQKVPDDIKPGFMKELSFVNFNRTRIFSVMLLAAFLILTSLDLVNRANGLWELPGYAGLFYIHASTTFLLLLLTFAFFINPPRSAEALTSLHRITFYAFVLLLVFSALTTAMVDQLIHGQISAYLIVAFGLGAVLLLRNAESTVMYALSHALFMIGLGYFQKDPQKLTGHYINGTMLTIVAWLLSRVAYTGYKKIFIHRKTIEQQNISIREMADRIRLSETEYRQLFENSPLGVFRTTPEGKVLAANRSLLRLLGAGSIEEMNTVGILSFYANPGDRALLWEKLRTGPLSGFETVFALPDGSTMPVSISGNLVLTEEGKPAFLEGTIEDISERKKTEEALRETNAELYASEVRYRLLVENSHDIILTMNMKGGITFASPSWTALLGHPVSQVTGRQFQEFVHPDDLTACVEYLRDILESRPRASGIEYRIQHADGTWRWHKSNGVPLRGEAGNVMGFEGISSDITGRKNAETRWAEAVEELRRSEEKYRLVAENSEDVIYTLDPDLRFTYVSPSFGKLYGINPNEVIEQKISIDRITTPASLGKIYAEYESRRPDIEKGVDTPVLLQIEQYRGDGSTFWVESSVKPMRDGEGRLTGFMGMTRDISERRRAEEKMRAMNVKLRASEMEYRHLYENSPTGIFRMSLAGRVLEANPAALRILQFDSPDSFNMMGMDSLFAVPSDRDRLISMVRQGTVSGFETTLRRGNGEDVPLSISVFLETDEKGKPLYFEGTIEDISKRRRAEDLLRKANEDLAAANEELTNSNEEFETANEELIAINQELSDTYRALRESETKYRLLAENSGDVIITLDTNFSVTYASPAVLKVRGVTPEESMGQTIDQIMTAASIEAAFADYSRVLPEIEKGNNPISRLEFELYRKDGSTVWVEISLTTMRDDAGKLKGFIGVYRDISERRRAEEALRESEEKYKFIVDNTSDIIWIFDLATMTYTYGSKSVEKIMGYTIEESVGKTLNDIYSPETKRAVQERFGKVVTGREPSDQVLMEAEHITKNGSRLWMEINAVLKRDMNGRPVAFNGVTRDITKRRLAEQELRESERRLADIINFLPIATFVIDRGGKITAWNRAMEEMTGVKSADMIGKGDHEYALPFYGERRPILIDRVFASDEELSTRFKHIRREGGVLVAESYIPNLSRKGNILLGYASALRDSEGKIIGAIESIRDITEMRLVEDELKEAEEKYRNILESMDSGYYEVDLKGKMKFCNPAFKKFLGFEDAEIQDLNFKTYMDDEEAGRIYRIFNEVYTTGNPSGDFYWRFTRNGMPCAYSVSSAYPMRDGSGSIVGFRGNVKDITAIKEAKDAADEANRSKSVFLANMSHEIRTPMNAILGYAQLMQRDPGLTAQLRDYLDIINRSGEHLMSLINDILEMSKIEAGRSQFVRTTFDLHLLLENLERMFRIRTDARGLHFLVDNNHRLPRWISTDEPKLRQILINLLGNAVKFTAEGGIALRIDAQPGKSGNRELVIEVEDTGPGIAQEEIDHLFQAFEQTRTGIGMGGTGLGLALSRGFAQIMGGSLTVSSTVGRGSIFRLIIPFIEGEKDQAVRKAAMRRVSRLKSGQDMIRVLIADDRDTNRTLLSRLLALAGFVTREAVNGVEVMHIFHEWKPRIVLMDMTMPVMDGYEATRRIKAEPDGRKTIIIAVTASAFEEDRQHILSMGADGYLSKPFREEELFSIIRQLTGIEYAYDEEETAPIHEQAPEETSHLQVAIASLPADTVRRLHDATVSADIDLMNEIIDEIAGTDASTARTMREMASRYAYDDLINLLYRGA